MAGLPENLGLLRESFSRIRPWAAVAGLCAAVLLGFYSLEALQYWNAWNDVRTMTSDIERISSKLERGVPSSDTIPQDQELAQQRLEYLQGLFQYPDVARLIGIVSTTSWDTGIDLPAITSADPTLNEMDGMEYGVQVLGLTARGSLPDIYRFLATLHQRVRVVSTPNISLSNPSSAEAAAQIQMNFYISPKPIVEKDGAD